MNFHENNYTPPRLLRLFTVEFGRDLMILKPGTDNTCNIGIHRWNYLHLFQVILVVNKPESSTNVVRLLTGAPLSDNFLYQCRRRV